MFSSLSALRVITPLKPVAGVGYPVAPPTYDGGAHAVSPVAMMPTPTGELVCDEHGQPRTAPAVVLSSIAGEAHHLEQAMREFLATEDIEAPGIHLRLRHSDDALLDIARAEVARKPSRITPERLVAEIKHACEQQHSSWEAAHRHADAYIRHAELEDGAQIWASPHSEEYEVLTTASQRRGDVLFRNFPNAALCGFWLSSRSPVRHSLARSLSAETVGYGAHEVASAATKADLLGGIASSVGMGLDADGTLVDGKQKPSALGLGSIISSPVVSRYSCESILHTATVSLSQLRRLQFPGWEPDQREAALDVLAALALIAVVDTTEYGMLRSGADLIPDGTPVVTAFDRGGVEKVMPLSREDLVEAFRSAYAALDPEHQFAAPMIAYYPEVLLRARMRTLAAEAS